MVMLMRCVSEVSRAVCLSAITSSDGDCNALCLSGITTAI